ncbi:Serine/threonine-protein kinase [Hordeum vulgare]|nr:Serine/threonine-protein kinase [Hordeum vulgare]
MTTTNADDLVGSLPARHPRSRKAAILTSCVFLLATDDNGRDIVFNLRFALPPRAATGMVLKVNSSGRLRALSTAYSLTAARATLPTGYTFYRCRLQPM